MSSSLSTSFNTLALREAGFIGDVMRTTLAYLQENEGKISQQILLYGEIVKSGTTNW